MDYTDFCRQISRKRFWEAALGTPKRNVKLLRFMLAAALLCAVVAFPRLAFSAEQKVALVIGNSAYPTSRLRNPVNDAKAMADKLKALGFDVILRTNSNLREMTRSFSEFGRKLVPGSVSLFYYAGHGMQVRGKNFLIPIDAEIDNEASVRSEAVDVEQILDHLGAAKLSMVILDACRNNPFERRIRAGTGSGLAQIDAPSGTLLAYATAPGKVAADGDGANGLYTSELLKAIDTPGLKIEDVFKQVRINVLKASDNQQIPWESSSLTSEFYFRPGTLSAGDGKHELQQANKVQAELQKALLEERRKREREAEEMERLRAELLKLKEDSLPGAGPQSAATSPAQPTQVATASAQVGPGNATAPALAAEWAQRMALLEKLRGQLTLSKAIAVLLDISAANELSLLLTREADIRKMKYSNAFAMGIDGTGKLAGGIANGWASSGFARDTALEHCSNSGGKSCKVVVLNGDFQDSVFFEVTKQLGTQNVASVRQAYMQAIQADFPAAPLQALNNWGYAPGFGFSLAQK